MQPLLHQHQLLNDKTEDISGNCLENCTIAQYFSRKTVYTTTKPNELIKQNTQMNKMEVIKLKLS